MGKEKDLRHGHRDRMRKAFLKAKRDDEFPDYQLLEMLLFYTLPRVDTRVIAHELMIKFGSLSRVFDAKPEELAEVKGVSESFAVLLKLALTVARRYSEDKIKNEAVQGPIDIGRFLLEQYNEFKVETLSMVSLNAMGNLLAFDIINDGLTGSVTVSAKKIVEKAINNNAHSVILAHNHPSGIAIPSKADAQTTVQIKNILEQVGIYLVDHIILDKQDYVSMAQSSEFADIF